MPSRASELLSNLPSRGYFVNAEATTTRAPAYVCSHDSRPPIHQRLYGDNQPYLVRLLLQKKSKEAEQRRKQQQGKDKAATKQQAGSSAGKRPAASTPAEPSKRANVAGPSSVAQQWTPQNLRGKTNNELGQVLRTLGGKPSSKKKDELIADILQRQDSPGA